MYAGWKNCMCFDIGGSSVAANGISLNEVMQRIINGRKVMGAVRSMTKDKNMYMWMNKTEYYQEIFPTVVYGAEAWD